MKRSSLVCLLAVGFTACASAGPEILRPGVATSDESYAVAFAENPQPERYAAFRDAIALELRARGLTVSPNPSRVSIVILLETAERVSNCVTTCGLLDKASITFTERGDVTNPIARATIDNGRRTRGSVTPGSLAVSVRADGTPRVREMDDTTLAMAVADDIMRLIG
jgi:hypothetical protein